MRSTFAATLLLIAMPLSAATFAVTSGADSGPGTLRWAIEQANGTPGADSIPIAAGLTIRPTSPLPPITETANIGGGILDGALAGDAGGLVIRADGVGVSDLTITNFGGDGIIVDANGCTLEQLVVSSNRNGIQMRGRSNVMVGSWIVNNLATGVWVRGDANTISKWDDPSIAGLFSQPPRAVMMTGNQTGMVLDGTGNVVEGATLGNRGDAIVVNREGNLISLSTISGYGGSGIVMNAPAEVRFTTGCSRGTLIAGSSQPAPQVLSAVADATVTTVDGRIDGAVPNSLYHVEIATADHPCSFGNPYLEFISYQIATDERGTATFHFFYPAAAKTITMASTLWENSGHETSAFSLPFTAVTNAVSPSDLETKIVAPPRATIGSIFDIEIHVTNHGPSPVSGATLSFDGSSSLAFLARQVDYPGSCSSDCSFGPLGPGQTSVVKQRVRVLDGATPATYAATVHAPFGIAGAVDPYPANNSATVTIEVQPARSRAVRH